MSNKIPEDQKIKKNRVTLKMNDIPYERLRLMAAKENSSMGAIVEDFVMGERYNLPPQVSEMESKPMPAIVTEFPEEGKEDNVV